MRITALNTAFAALVCLAIAGCDGNGTNPNVVENDRGNGGKGPQVLSACVDAFAGIRSCAIGSANLERQGDGLMVTGFDAIGRSGVSSQFADANDWSQSVDFSLAGGRHLKYSAISDGEAVSTLRLAVNPDGNGFSIDPTFTGSAGTFHYRVDIYNGTSLVASLPHRGPGSPLAHIIGGDGGGGTGCWVWRNTGFKNEAGQCIWQLNWRVPCPYVVVEFDDAGPFTTDRIVVTEEREDGHYPYRTFSSIHLTGNPDYYRISGESANYQD